MLNKIYILILFFACVNHAQTVKDIDIYKGDSHTISFEAPYDVSSDSLLFVVKADRDDDTPRVIALRNTAGGGSDSEIRVIYSAVSTILVKLTQINTEGLEPALYVYDLTIDSTTTLYTGTLKLRDEVGGSTDGVATRTPYYVVALDTPEYSPSFLIGQDSDNSWDNVGDRAFLDSLGWFHIPNQTNFVGTVYLGNPGGLSLDNTGSQAGDFNTYVGYLAGTDNTIAKKNTGVGYNTLNATISGWANTGFGYNVLSTGIGTGSLDIGGTGIEFYANVGIGESVLTATTTGSYNTAMGTNSMIENTTGSKNTAYGLHSMNDNLSGDFNVAIGTSVLRNNLSGDGNIAIGNQALFNSETIDDQIAIGTNALHGYVSGSAGNVAIGYNSQVANTNGVHNVSLGYNTLKTLNNGGGRNTAIGYSAGQLTFTNSSYNTYVGWFAGNTIATTATYNTFIGASAGYSVANQKTDAVNSMSLGANTYTNASNQVVIGDAGVTSIVMAQDTGAVIYAGGLDVDGNVSVGGDLSVLTGADGITTSWSNNGLISNSAGVFTIQNLGNIFQFSTNNGIFRFFDSDGNNTDATLRLYDDDITNYGDLNYDYDNLRFNLTKSLDITGYLDVDGVIDFSGIGSDSTAVTIGQLWFNSSTGAIHRKF